MYSWGFNHDKEDHVMNLYTRSRGKPIRCSKKLTMVKNSKHYQCVFYFFANLMFYKFLIQIANIKILAMWRRKKKRKKEILPNFITKIWFSLEWAFALLRFVYSFIFLNFFLLPPSFITISKNIILVSYAQNLRSIWVHNNFIHILCGVFYVTIETEEYYECSPNFQKAGWVANVLCPP